MSVRLSQRRQSQIASRLLPSSSAWLNENIAIDLSSRTPTPDRNRPRKRLKRCCRKFVTFMCTQVGVGALIVFYAICGAFSFMNIEREYVDLTGNEMVTFRHLCAENLWTIMEHLNTFDHQKWLNETDFVLQIYQKQIVSLIKQGYVGRTPEQIWSFPAALMFCLSVITMIGYGNMVPRTPWGKGFTVIYATFGIPLYILYFLNMGKVLAGSFKFIYRSLHDCTRDRSNTSGNLMTTGSVRNSGASARLSVIALESGRLHASWARKKIIVPTTACLWVIIFYILTGTIMFANWEKWSFLNSFYFCMTSLCKIGFGDFVPGASLTASSDIDATTKKVGGDTDEISELQLITDQNSKLAINFIYMLIGMGLVAMCYNLMREEVRVKFNEIREDTKLCLEETQDHFSLCCKCRRRMDEDLDQDEDWSDNGVIGGGATNYNY